MAYIHIISPEEAEGTLHELYQTDQNNLGYIAGYTKVLSLRPEVTVAWRDLLSAIRSHMDVRRYELVTLAAATAMKSRY